MSIGGLSQFKYTTDWEYETSRDVSVGVIGTYSTGTVILRQISDPTQKMTINYRALAASFSHGLPVGKSKSQFSDDSGGFGPVSANNYFTPGDFPCKGYILGLGGTVGALDDLGAAVLNRPAPNGVNGIGVSIFYFGVWPFAGFRCWGTFTASTPGLGVSAAIAGFALA